MKEKTGTHYSPAQTRAPAHRNVSIGDVQNPLGDEMNDLPIERCLKPVCDMTNDFLSNVDRLFSDRLVKGDRALNGFWRGFCSSDHLDQRNHMGWVEWMADYAAFRASATRLDGAHRQSG